MAYGQPIYQAVHRQYEMRQEERKALIEERQRHLYTCFPRLKEIDDALDALAFSVFREVAAGHLSADACADKIKKSSMALYKERAALLEQAHLPEDYLNPPYACANCRDTGRAPDGTACACFRNACVKEAFQSSHLTDAMKLQTFENARTDRYHDEHTARYMKQIAAICKDFVATFDDSDQHLFFYGASGLGKTYFSSAIANALLEKGKSVCYQSAVRIFSLLEDIHFGRNHDADMDTIHTQLLESDLLIIDDLGTEFVTAFSLGELFYILNSRLLSHKKMIINSNIEPKDLQKTYSERISSRILGEFTACKFIGSDLRLG